jgi:hypothetical protein
MKDRRTLILFGLSGILMGIAAVLNVTSHADVRAVDVLQLFAGGMATGAALMNLIHLSRGGTVR